MGENNFRENVLRSKGERGQVEANELKYKELVKSFCYCMNKVYARSERESTRMNSQEGGTQRVGEW